MFKMEAKVVDFWSFLPSPLPNFGNVTTKIKYFHSSKYFENRSEYQKLLKM